MKYNLRNTYITLLAVLVFLAGCKKEYESIEEIDSREVQSYIKANNLDVQQYNNTGIYYQIITPGTGEVLDYTDKIYATFTAKSLDGRFSMQADSLNRFTSFLGYFSTENGYPAAFATAIKEIPLRSGGTIRLIIPSHRAYGRSGNSSLDIPGNSSLDCTITLYDVDNQAEFEDVFVRRYIQANKITIDNPRTPNGLYYQILNEGSGEEVNEASEITVKYTGKLTNGTVFDESASYTSYLYLLIPGWQQGLPKIKEGGKIRLIVPPALGYGSSPTGAIPPYSTLDFTIELLDVQ